MPLSEQLFCGVKRTKEAPRKIQEDKEEGKEINQEKRIEKADSLIRKCLTNIERTAGPRLAKILYISLLFSTGLGVGIGAKIQYEKDRQEQEEKEDLTRPEDERAISIIDERFQERGMRPEQLHVHLTNIFGERIWQDINRLEYSANHIRMPGTYLGKSPFEAGHCITTARRGERSEVTLTIDAFDNVDPRSTLSVLIHEIGHALDYESADDMPGNIRREISNALQELVAGNKTTIYSYVNSYEGGSSTEEEEDRLQKKEAYAEIIADGVTFEPLPPNDPLIQLPLEDQLTHQIARRHNVSLEIARPYAKILVKVEEWQGRGFWRHAQEGFRNMNRELRNSLRDSGDKQALHIRNQTQERLHNEFDAQSKIWGILEEGAGYSRVIRMNPPIAQTMEAIDGFMGASRDGWEAQTDTIIMGQKPNTPSEHQQTTQENHTPFNERLHRIIREDRQTYIREHAMSVHNAELRAIFLSMIGEDRLHPHGDMLSRAVDDMRKLLNATSIRETEIMEERIREDWLQINNILNRVEHNPNFTAQDRKNFYETVETWVRDEAASAWYRHIANDIAPILRAFEERI